MGKQTDLGSGDDDHSQQLICSQHRNRQHGPHGSHVHHPIGKLGLGPNVFDMDGSSLAGGASGGTLATGPNGICFDECPERWRMLWLATPRRNCPS